MPGAAPERHHGGTGRSPRWYSSRPEGPLSRIVGFFKEAKRRKVYVSGVAYIVVGIAVIELVGAVSEALLFPDWTPRLITFLIILGLPIVLVLAWVFDITSKGIVRSDDVDSAAPAPVARSTAQPAPPPRPGPPPARALAGLARPTESARRPRPVEVAAPAEPPDPARVRRAALGHMRHELRTPMNGIIGYSEMLLEDAQDEDIVADLQRIREGARRLLALVDSILDPSSPESGADLDALAERIRVDLRTPTSAVVGYAEMLVETCRERGQDDMVPDLERILTSARRLLELSGDIVQMALHGDTGASLSDSQVITREVLSKIRPLTDRGAPVEGQGRLLVVDDNAVNRDLLSRQLARHGYTVATAEDGERGLELLRSHSFDLVLMDVIMPRLNGIDALRRMKADDLLAEVPVIMLSSLDEVDSAVRCIEMGAEEYLAKPIQPSLLESRIAANLDVRRLRARERALQERLLASDAFLERMLAACFPAGAAARIRAGDDRPGDAFHETTVLYAAFARELRPGSLAGLDAELHRLRSFAALVEPLAEAQGVDICIWSSDALVAARSAATEGEDGAAALATFALEVLSVAGQESAPLAIGLHTGSAAGAVLGAERMTYQLWGDAVETARAIAGRSPAGSILVSPATHALLRDRFAFDSRGVADLGAMGQMRVYALRGTAGVPLEPSPLSR